MSPRHDRTRHAGRAGTRWFVAGYAGLAGFFAFEAIVRERGAASSLTASNEDHGSTRAIVVAYVLAASLSPGLRRVPLRPLPTAIASAGLGIEAAGLAVRIWSMRTLKGSYSRTLRTGVEQHLVDHGPYRLVRHPGYLGSLLTWTGFALTSRSVPVVTMVAALMALAYSHRIEAEEDLLARELPGFIEYSHRTKKLFPLVW